MQEENGFRKSLSAFDIWSLALGAMIGFGCFVLPGSSFLPKAGPLGTALGIAIGAGMVMVISVSFSYLVCRYPLSGGSFLYANIVFGKLHAFVLAWFLVLTYWSLVPLNATALGLIGRNLFPGLLQFGHLYTVAGWDVYAGEIVVAFAALIGVTAVNLWGAKAAGWIQSLITLGLLGSVLLFAGGVFLGSPTPANLSPAFPQGRTAFAAVFSIIAMTPWAFIGFDCVPQAAEEYSFPPKKAMFIMLSSILIAAGLYIVVNTCTAIVQPWEELLARMQTSGGWATGEAVSVVLGRFGLSFVGLAMLCAVVSGMNAFLLSASRLMYAMASCDALPSWFGRLDPKTGVPKNGLLFLLTLSLFAPFFGREVINWVVDMTSVGASLSFAYATATAFVLARRAHEPAYAALGLLGLGFSLFFLVLLLCPGMPGFLSTPSLAAMGIWTLLGAAFYLVMRKKYLASDKLDRLTSLK